MPSPASFFTLGVASYQDLSSPADAWRLMRPVRGHRMAKATIENACWDLAAKRAGKPLWQYLGGVQPEIPSGVSIGIQDSPAILIEKIEKELAAGYQRIKIKIKPGWDIEMLKAVRQT